VIDQRNEHACLRLLRLVQRNPDLRDVEQGCLKVFPFRSYHGMETYVKELWLLELGSCSRNARMVDSFDFEKETRDKKGTSSGGYFRTF
jgi:hypothetical protein